MCWSIEPASLPLVQGHPAIDEVIVFDRQRGWKAFWPFLAKIRARKFDLVLDLQRHLKSGIVSWWSGAPQRIGFSRTDTKELNWIFNNMHIEALGDDILSWITIKFRRVSRHSSKPHRMGLCAYGRRGMQLAVTLLASAIASRFFRRHALAEQTVFPAQWRFARIFCAKNINSRVVLLAKRTIRNSARGGGAKRRHRGPTSSAKLLT